MYLEFPRWALMATPAERPPRDPAEPHGILRNGKMAELRADSGILWIRESVFCFLSSSPHLRWFRVFIGAALGVGC